MSEQSQNNQIPPNSERKQDPQSLDVYKMNWRYRLKQKIKWMTPKKKWLFFGLPGLVLILGVVLYFTLAAPGVSGDPQIRLEMESGGSLAGQTFECGETYRIKIVVNSNVSRTSGNGIVTAGAYIYYDSSLMEVNLIDVSNTDFSIGEEDTTPGNPGTLQVIGSDYVQVIRGEPSPGFSGQDGLILATLEITILPEAYGDTFMRFYGTEPGDNPDWDTLFLLDDGAEAGVDYSPDDGRYDFSINCCPSHYICATSDDCPLDNWFGDPADLCCNEPCVVNDNKVRLCEGIQPVVDPSYDSVVISWCTTPNATCTTTIYDDTGAQVDEKKEAGDLYIRSHLASFNGLGSQDTADTYTYNIDCQQAKDDPTDDSDNLILTGEFTTLRVTDLVISDVTVSNIGANRATINWTTSHGLNGDGRSDTRIKYHKDILSGKHEVISTQLVTFHSVDLVGLEADTVYRFGVASYVNEDPPPCNGSGDSTPTCASSEYLSFTTLKARSAADANLVVKVNRDRVCDEWLYCQTAVQALDTKRNPPQYEDLCFSVGLCDALDPGGKCANSVVATPGIANKTSPYNVGDLRNYSGLTKAGLDWGKRCLNTWAVCDTNSDCGSGADAKCVSARVGGYFPYSLMKEMGLPVGIANANFEDMTIRPWQPMNRAKIANVMDDNKNRVLRIKPFGNYSGAKAMNLARTVKSGTDEPYVISFRAKTDDSRIGRQDIWAGIGFYDKKNVTALKYYNDETHTNTDRVTLTNEWRNYVVSIPANNLPSGISDKLSIAFLQAPGESSNAVFYIDNVSMKKVLRVADTESLVSRSCRMYPSQNAPACDYYDASQSKNLQGWKGYCVETDPKFQDRKFVNQPMCLNWWPVDIIAGESNSFSQDNVAGYTGRQPLYYCVEAEGNYPYVEKNKYKVWDYDCDKGVSNPGKDYKGRYVSKGGSISSGFSPSGVYGLKYNIEAIEVKWQFARDDGSCTLQHDWHSLILNRGNNFKDNQQITNVTFSFSLDDNGHFSIDAKSNGLDSSSGTITKIYLTYYMREPCNVIAQVVSPDGENVSWASRIQKGGWTEDNYLGYAYDTDYYPYGAAVANEPSWDPNQWDDPLYVMPADRSFAGQAPYQVRAGTPYSFRNEMAKATCQQGNVGSRCGEDADCGGGVCELVSGGDSNNADDYQCVNGTQLIDGYSNCSTSQTPRCVSGLNTGDRCSANGNSDCDDFNNPVTGTCLSSGACDNNNDFYLKNYNVCLFGIHIGAPCEDFNDCSDATHVGTCGIAADWGTCRTEGGINYDTLCMPEEICRWVADGGVDNSKCYIPNSCQIEKGSYTAQCVAGSADNLGNECKNNADCGYSADGSGNGLCMGAILTNQQKIKIGGGYEEGEKRLSELFAKSIKQWRWQRDTKDNIFKYMLMPDDKNWNITASRGKPTRVPNIWINDSQTSNFVIIGEGPAVLKFSSWADPNQLPLVRYSVDWGDGTESSEGGLHISGRSSDNPHILVHYYKFDNTCIAGDDGVCDNCPDIDHNGNCDNCKDIDGDGEDDYCFYQPQVQVEDNWGKCNGTGNCDDKPGGWKQAGNNVMVYRQASQTAQPNLQIVSGQTLTYIDGDGYSLPFTQPFVVQNEDNVYGNLNWRIVSVTGFSKDIWQFEWPHHEGYQGILAPGQTEEVKFTILNSNGLGVGSHSGDILLDNIDDPSNQVTVHIIVDVKSAP